MMTADKDKLAQEVIDRLLKALPDWMSAEMSMCDWSGDPWGELMALWFALNDACVATDFTCHESFVPSPFGPDTESYWYDVFVDGMAFRVLTNEEVAGWHKLFDTAHHALKLLGKDY